MKTISQNPDRYSKVGSSWVISANGDSPNKGVTPLYLPIGVPLQNLKPLIKADGIIVKVGENYLCSLTTINLIKDSNNPHYDIIQNGMVKVKDKQVAIGQTIKIVELNIDNLIQSILDRDTLNKNAGVTHVTYSPLTEKIDGVPKGIIDQINYTLDQESIRPMDEYSITDLYLMVDYKNNKDASHYDILPITEANTQQELIFYSELLQRYLTEIADKLKLLEDDFNIIQDIFYDASLPDGAKYFSMTEEKQASTDTDTNVNHSVRRYYRSKGGFTQSPAITAAQQSQPTTGGGTSTGGGGTSGGGGGTANPTIPGLPATPANRPTR